LKLATRKQSFSLRSILSFAGLLLVVFLGTFFVQTADGLDPDIQGSGYRLYANADSTTPGSPLAVTNTSATLSTPGQGFRLRAGIKTRADAINITDIATGATSSCLIASGNVYCSGTNTVGQLGNGTTNPSTSFTPVVKDSGVLAGKYATSVKVTTQATNMGACALADGQVYCWGSNQYFGFSALNRTTPSTVPVLVNTGALAGKTVSKIVYGEGFICAVSEGQVYCWGVGPRTGRGSNSDTTVPTAVVTSGVLNGKTVTDIAAGAGHACVIADATVYCWGLNGPNGDSPGGQLGNGTITDSNVPVTVSNGPGTVLYGKTMVAVAAGGQNSCALDNAGQVYCWGYNNAGQIGNGTSGTASSSNVPVAVLAGQIPAGVTIVSIAGGGQLNCAIGSNGRSYCWGNGGGGSMGNGSTTFLNPSPVATTMTGVNNLSTMGLGIQQTCATGSGAAYCWGRNSNGQLGITGTNASNTTPLPVLTTNITPGDGVTLASNTTSYKLQFAQKTAGSCSSQTGFADVTTTSAIAWNTNPSAANGTAISTTTNDPTANGDTFAQTYVSNTGAFTNPTAITPGKFGLWDFSLKDNSNVNNQAYCLRLAQGTGTAYSTYAAYPEIVTANGVLSVGIVDNAGVAVASPSLSLPSTTVSTSCQSTNGLLGTTSQKLRVSNETSSPSWSLSLAATAGSTSKWHHQTEPYNYDFNDPSGSPSGCFSGSDGDMIAGRLTVNPADPAALVTPKSGCSNTGISLGSAAGFSEGITDAITIVSASSSASTICYWDITGIGLTQMIPASQPAGTYTIDMTATVLAQ
jgi:alpha-tubulin suppressor-like RCC1 family protein